MKTTNDKTHGTSFYGKVLTTTVRELMNVLGEPTHNENTGGSEVNFFWACKTNMGRIVTIYDYNVGRPIDLDEKIEFNIGGYSNYDTLLAKHELIDALANMITN